MKDKEERKKRIRKLVSELKDLYLREGTELSERGLYHQLLKALPFSGGHIDKDTEKVVRFKDLILELERELEKV